MHRQQRSENGLGNTLQVAWGTVSQSCLPSDPAHPFKRIPTLRAFDLFQVIAIVGAYPVHRCHVGIKTPIDSARDCSVKSKLDDPLDNTNTQDNGKKAQLLRHIPNTNN